MEEIIDLEIFAKEGKTPAKGKKYKFRVDKTVITVSVESLTGKEILIEAGLNPENFLLRMLKKGHKPVPIALDERVNFTEPGIERFVTIPKDPKDGGIK